MIKFFIPGIPAAKATSSALTQDGYVTVYKKKKTRVWEDHVKWSSIPHRPKDKWQGAVIIKLLFEMPRPKTLPKKYVHHLKKPDADNLQKSVIDALKKAAFFRDDSQVVFKIATKRYSKTPGVYVMVGEIDIIDYGNLIKDNFNNI